MQQSTCFSLIEHSVSRARLALYNTGADPDDVVYARYLWNVALCEALYPTFNYFEIALRNAIHREAMQHRGNPWWFRGRKSWNTGFLLDREADQVDRAHAEVQKRTAVTPGRIVAELRLGFWNALFYSAYRNTFYAPIAKAIFPGASSKQINQSQMEKRITRIRLLRNRVVHHERIWDSPTLVSDHALIVETIEWISPVMHATLAMLDRFDDVYRLNIGPYQASYSTWKVTLPP
jgi:hypothetical protein